MSRRCKALLLAAGLGTRLRPLTDTVPKCLVAIAGKPLIDYWFDKLEAVGVMDVLINTHHLREPVVQHLNQVAAARRFRIREAHEPKLLGSAGTLHANRDWMDDADECLIIYADNFSTVALERLIAFHRGHGDPMTMLLFHTPYPKQCGIATLDATGRVVEFVEKPAQPTSDLANAGLYVVTAAAYREMADKNAFDLGFDVLPDFVGRMRGFPFAGYHRDIGNYEALKQTEEFVSSIGSDG
jgi:mannose-1-phosphate guanylyltransferase